MRDIGDQTYGYTATPSGENVHQIFDSSFSEWIAEWTRPEEITLTAKASGYLEGYSYALSASGGLFKRVLGPIFGLTRLADSTGAYSLFSYSTARGMQLKVLDEVTGSYLELPTTVLPEKCVWSKQTDAFYCAVPSTTDLRVYPDDWYQGLYFSSDTLWRMDASTGVGSFIADLSKEGGEPVDAISLGLTKDESFLYFINKRDNMLWGFSL